MKKITRAMELIAASRIIKAQQRAQAAAPYARELTRAVSAVATYSNVDHPLTTRAGGPQAGRRAHRDQRPRPGRRLLLERAQGGRAARREAARARARRSTPTSRGRKGEAYFKFRQRRSCEVVDRLLRPADLRRGRARSATRLIDAFLADSDGTVEDATPPVDEVHVVYTRFRSMLVQEPTAVRLLPLEVVEGEEQPEPTTRCCRSTSSSRRRRTCSTRCCRVRPEPDLLRPAAGRRLRAGRPAEGDEVRDGQRRRAHQEVHPDRQPGPPGRDHPGNQRDRRWRQRAGRRQRAGSE